MIPGRRAIAIAAALALGPIAAASLTRGGAPRADACSPLDPSMKRGRGIFQRGEARAPIEGRLDRDGASMKGRDAACASCHGPRGEGRGEGAIVAPPLTPTRLFAPRERAYDHASLARALREGVTPEGRALRLPMPRYALDDEAVTDLAAYLGCLGRERDPGVSDDAVRVGAALPMSGPRAEIGRAARDALLASFAALQARWRIDLLVEDTSLGGARAAVDRLISQGIFALVASAAPGDARDDDLPVILPLSAPAGPALPRSFTLFMPPEERARVAVTHLARASRNRLLVAHDRGEAGARWLASARREAAKRGLPAPRSIELDGERASAASLVEAADAAHADAILLVGSSASAALGLAAIEARRGVHLYCSEAPADIPPSLRERTWILEPGLARGELSAAIANLEATLNERGLPARHLAVRAHAAIAARVLDEALRRAGSPPTRDALITSLEGLRGFETGLSPPLTFARDRHVGVMGAYVERAAGGVAWIEITP